MNFSRPISPDNPCGENLSTTLISRPGSGQSGKAEAAVWRHHHFRQSLPTGTRVENSPPACWVAKDLRVMLALTHAWTRRHGWRVTPTGYCWCRSPVRYWEQHPLLEEYGETDPFTASTPSPGW